MSARMKGIFEPSAQAIIPKPSPSIFLTIPTIFTPAREPTSDRTSDKESGGRSVRECRTPSTYPRRRQLRSEEHTSELQPPDHLVCRLLLEKKKINHNNSPPTTISHNHHPTPPSRASVLHT